MRSFVSRRGSALLVVLGMLAFMVVSAVAFSAYMRRARLPSNYLRRATSSRELVKAALTRAIDDIDHAVNDNPHPGLGKRACSRYDENTKTSNTNRNGWVGRVFMNTDMSQITTKEGDIPNGAAHPNDTVSVLSLEGLAYVPAPLQGEARYYSRRTPTAKWQAFDFDAGRYAYVALDVSDFLDVNRMFANEPRSSAANTRLTLAYLFENGGASGWDTLLKQIRDVDSDLNISFDGHLPLTSVADMNLFIGSRNYGPFKSWFYEYLLKSGKVEVGTDPSDNENPRLMPIITDALYATNTIVKSSEAYSATWSGNGEAGDPYDLASPASQPFDFANNWSEDLPYSMDDVYEECKGDNYLWGKYLGLVGMCALCDYLDPDHVPTSLSIPTVERVPMICGFKIQSSMSGEFGLTRDPATDNDIKVLDESGKETTANDRPTQQDQTRTVTATVIYRLSLGEFALNNTLQVATVFPFAHKDERDTSGWSIDGRFSLFLTEGTIKLRTDEAGDVLHLTKDDVPNIQASKLADEGVVNVKMEGGAPSFTVPDDIYKCSNLSVDGSDALADLLKQNFLTVVYTWEQKAIADRSSIAGGATLKWDPWFNDIKNDTSKRTVTLGLPILGTGGTVAYKKGQTWTGDPPLKDLQLNAAVWLRVKDSKNRVVDMVPACPDDDNPQLRGKDNVSSNINWFRTHFGQPYPLMLLKINGKKTHQLDSVTALDDYCSQGKAFTIADNAFYSLDPRYNYAPESWYQKSGGGIENISSWQDGQNAFGNSGKDIYFATSDAGYLQNLYELSNLPWLTNLTPSYSVSKGESLLKAPDNNNDSIWGNKTQVSNYDYFWKNYDLRFNDPINVESNLLFHTSYKGQRVNPYSDNIEVIRGVFANTPLDWKRASTNKASSLSKALSECAGKYIGEGTSFNSKYTWTENSESSAKITREELERFAMKFIKEVRKEVRSSENPQSWDDILANMLNDAEPNNLGGISLGSAKLYKSDRDFLYGYWRDCFAAQQQLYLIFVRAEPLLMGGASVGSAPPQLGGRAVALVWRDPTVMGNKGGTNCSGYPHSTRVLFYKNLE